MHVTIGRVAKEKKRNERSSQIEENSYKKTIDKITTTTAKRRKANLNNTLIANDKKMRDSRHERVLQSFYISTGRRAIKANQCIEITRPI
jgi:hypothetical protein